jgi:hypothetical protein
VKQITRTSVVVGFTILLSGALLPAAQNSQKPVRTYSIHGEEPKGGLEPEGMFGAADAVLLVRINSSKPRLAKSGSSKYSMDVVRTDHQVTVIEVLKGDQTLRANTDIVIEGRDGEVDAGDYILKSPERALSKGEWILFLTKNPATGVLLVQDHFHALRIQNGKINTEGATRVEGADAAALLARLRGLRGK